MEGYIFAGVQEKSNSFFFHPFNHNTDHLIETFALSSATEPNISVSLCAALYDSVMFEFFGHVRLPYFSLWGAEKQQVAACL